MLSAKRPVTTALQAKTPTFSEEQETAPLSVLAPNTSKLLAPLDNRVTTGGLTNSFPGSTQSRIPMVIKGDMKRAAPLPPRPAHAHHKHRKRLWILGMLVLVMTIAATLLVSTAHEHDPTLKANQATGSNTQIVKQQNGISAQATATWMYENDGYDPYSNGEVTISDGTSSLLWPYGQCTYWANYEYHQETGFWVQWTGNADQWFLGAKEAGWDYSQTPPPGIHSIIVLMPYVQGSGWLGHVAVVESQTGNVVHTSNMNWGYGGSTHVEDVDFTVGPGVYFVWHPPVN